MREVSSSFARANWSQIIDDARLEPIAITSHGRPRIVIANAAISDAVVAAYAAAPGLATPEPTREEIRAAANAAVIAPHQPWMDLALPYKERARLLRERKTELYPQFGTWTPEDEAIIHFEPSQLPPSYDELEDDD